MQNKGIKSILFMIVLCIICSLVLTLGVTVLKAPQMRNREHFEAQQIAKATAGNPNAVVVPFTFAGLWGPITGYLALDPANNTIVGLAITQHKETAGLGAEIEKSWYLEQWRGKKYAEIDNGIDAISGASVTSRAMLNGVKRMLETEAANGI